MNQQMIHQYGTKRKQDQSQLEQGMEGLSMNSYQSLEIRRSFIPIIHRNCILAMHNLVQAVIHTFNLPIDLTNNSLMKAAVNCILEEKDRAVSFEDWSLNEDISKMILYLWNNSDSIREAYRRRNELEIEYMDSARYWFNEMYRLVDPNYVPKIEDIMRMRVKTTGIVETELFLPIKVRKKFPSTNMLDHMEETQVQQVQTEKIIYQKSAVVLVGSQRNERKKVCYQSISFICILNTFPALTHLFFCCSGFMHLMMYLLLSLLLLCLNIINSCTKMEEPIECMRACFSSQRLLILEDLKMFPSFYSLTNMIYLWKKYKLLT